MFLYTHTHTPLLLSLREFLDKLRPRCTLKVTERKCMEREFICFLGMLLHMLQYTSCYSLTKKKVNLIVSLALLLCRFLYYSPNSPTLELMALPLPCWQIRSNKHQRWCKQAATTELSACCHLAIRLACLGQARTAV